MKVTNFEFKARVINAQEKEQQLLALHPVFKGEDHQIDTYFNVGKGRLKLREGNIENALIYYERPDSADAKQSNVLLYQHTPNASLKALLTQVHGVKTIVDKKRRIYFIDNVKFHFDEVETLGSFIEVEAIDADGSIGLEKLQQQCLHYFNFFNLQERDYVHCSYSDLLMMR